MIKLTHAARRGAATLMILTLGGCAQLGSVGNVLGGVLGGGGQNQVQGVVRGVDTRAQQIVIQQSDGSSVALAYDSQTQVVYQNQNYSVTSLDPGDQITARIQSTNNGGYYTDLVQVDQPTSGSGSPSGNVQTIQGTVRQVDTANGLFSLDVANYGTVIVALPYNVSRTDQNRFMSLRSGDRIRIAGVFLNNQRVELRQFY
ncbi:MAG: hypothetical protein HOQ09_04480 [Gemmatimonadaceae bacterium]|nr:hypothetical protein [Gemmatimonadaceae bacterium]